MVSKRKSYRLAAYKLFFGVLGLSAIVTEIVVLAGWGTLVPAHFFSFFTVESNIIAANALIVSGLGAAGIGREWRWLSLFRGAAVLYMAITGIVFSALLAGLEVDLTAVPWDNIVLHYIMPIAMVVDWLIDPPKRVLRFAEAAVWLIYPLGYLCYSLVRGEMIGWYPYPFLNPAPSGYGPVVWVAIGILLLALSLTWLLIKVRRVASR